MEDYQNCPICFEIPEKEIYQCVAGHTICNVCIASLTECPQCRVPYGGTRIRSRVLEALLDSQEFECKFLEKGCGHISKRSEITCHANSCKFNPDTFPFCNLIRYENCTFGLGCCTREQVIAHFQIVHKYTFYASKVESNGKDFMDWINRQPNRLSNGAFPRILITEGSETSPLFMCCSILNKPNDFLSFICSQIWSPRTDTKSYEMKCKFYKKPSNSNSNVAISMFPIVWSLKVNSLKETVDILKVGAIGVPIELLKSAGFGEEADDNILFEIITL